MDGGGYHRMSDTMTLEVGWCMKRDNWSGGRPWMEESVRDFLRLAVLEDTVSRDAREPGTG